VIDQERRREVATMGTIERLGIAPETVRSLVREKAAADHAQYPQYDGHWDGDEWAVVEILRDVTTKAGRSFDKGDLTIARRPEARSVNLDPDLATGWFAYSVRTKIDTWLRNEWVEVVGKEG
jgi:hypothetical protein